MKHLKVSAIVFAALLSACSTPQKLYEAKAYDEVILDLGPKLCEGKIKAKNVNLVANAYHKANQADHEKIKELRATGSPDIWPEVFQRYSNMKGRNEALKCLPKNVKNSFHYCPLDLDEEITTSRNKAEQYLIAKSSMQLKSGNKQDALEAKKTIAQLKHVNSESKRIPELQLDAMLQSAENVLVTFENPRYIDIPENFAATIVNLKANGATTGNANFDTMKQRGINYDMTIKIKLLNTEVTPEKVETATFSESSGSKTAKVTDNTISKTLTIKGVILYIDNETGEILLNRPFATSSNFRHKFATVKGDLEACSQQTMQLVEAKPLPFPTDNSMMIDAAKQLSKSVCKISDR